MFRLLIFLQLIDVNHPLRIALVNTLRNDFCQIYYLNANDLLRLPLLARDMSAAFINTFFYQPDNLTGMVFTVSICVTFTYINYYFYDEESVWPLR